VAIIMYFIDVQGWFVRSVLDQGICFAINNTSLIGIYILECRREC